MAGENEGCISFQAESLPTGSISFGRFELESLSWERRSSFSHNRYLEEVEKCSTPGSVTQKKAYFEAHFKKKALLCQASSAGHNGVEWRPTDSGIEDRVNYVEEYIDHGDKGLPQFTWNGETLPVPTEQEHDVMESHGGQLQYAWYDETPAASDEDEYGAKESNGEQLQFARCDETGAVPDEHQHDASNCEREVKSLPDESLTEPIPCNTGKVSNIFEQVENDVLQTQSRYGTVQSDKDNSYMVVQHKTENGTVNVGELLEKCDISSMISVVEEDNARRLKTTRKGSFDAKATVEQKPWKAKLVTTERNFLSSVEAFTKTSKKMERETALRTKTEKQTFLKVPPCSFSDSNLNSKDFDYLKAQSRQETNRGKGLGAKKGGIRSQSISGNSRTVVPQSANRPRKVVCSAKANIKQSSAAFNFKSDERAEKRKEFYTRMEEKHHAKEVQMNAIQARTQVETEAEIKQFRRSLNFKAKPMPAFYHEAVTRDSDRKKIVVKQVKPLKSRSKSTSCGTRAAPQANSSSVSKVTNSGGPSFSEPVVYTQLDYPMALGGSDGPRNSQI